MIGDSITDDCSYNGAWLQYLQPLLQGNRYAFTFVGRQISPPVGNFTERRHEGYCGSVIAAPGVLNSSVHGCRGNQAKMLSAKAAWLRYVLILTFLRF